MFTGGPQCFWFALWTTLFCHGYWHEHCFSFALPIEQLHFIMFIKRLQCLIFSPLPVTSFCYDYQQVCVSNFLSQWTIPVCCVYQQALMTRDLWVFTDFLSILEVLFSCHCRSPCMFTPCVTITSSTLFLAAGLVYYKEILYIVWRELYFRTSQTSGTHSHTII